MLNIMRFTVPVIALTFTASAAWAQHQVQQDGRLLDNNLRVGSGGINDQVGPTSESLRARNNIITGNVGGLGYFHGDVPYRATDEFRGDLPSNDLYNFRAQSAGPTIHSLSRPGTTANYQVNTIERSGTGTGLQQIQSPPDQRNWDGLVRYGDVQGAPSNQSLITARIEGDATRDDRLGYRQDERGRLLEVSASPLMGLRQRTVEQLEAQGAPGTLQNLPIGVERPGETPAQQQPDGAAPADEQDPMQQRGMAAKADDRLSAPVVGTITGTMSSGRSRSNLGTQIGAQLQGSVGSGRVGEQAVDSPERIAELEAALFQPVQGDVTLQPGDDVYLSLLERMQARRGGGAAEAQPRGDDRIGAAAPRVLEQGPSPEELRRAREERGQAMLQARGVIEPDAADAQEREPQGRLGELLQTIDHDLPAVESLAGERATRTNELMRKAEGQMAAGSFFDAEATYRTVRASDPDHTMARVGLIHARMGAGLFRSAALDLRSLFNEHPELIATRYDPKLLPTGDRLRWIRDELNRMIDETTRPEPALMLAYLGYQLHSRDHVAYGLDLAQARSPRDPLITVLRRIWLNGSDAAAGQDQRQQPDAAAAGGEAVGPAEAAPTPAEGDTDPQAETPAQP